VSAKGVFSPWGINKKETIQEKVQRAFADDPSNIPTKVMTFDGRAFQIIVSFRSYDKDPDLLTSYAKDALGRALQDVIKKSPTFKKGLTTQSIYLEGASEKELHPMVTLALGPLTLWVKASSFDPKMASLMAHDRLALAAVEAINQSKIVRDIFTEHNVIIARKA
jgi:hypothetical protein